MSPAAASFRARRPDSRANAEVPIVLASPEISRRRWSAAPDATTESRALAQALRIHEIAARCMIRRGVTSEAAGQEYLRGGLSSLAAAAGAGGPRVPEIG